MSGFYINSKSNSTIHQKQKNLIENALGQESPFHAYIFEGKRGIGKLGIAHFATFLIFKKYTQQPKEILQKKIITNQHEDVIYLASEKISIKDIRELKKRVEKTKLSPLVVIIDHFENINPEAQHTLLKTLEEPTENTFFFILAENASGVLPTVRSRSQTVAFQKISDQEIENYLNSKKVEFDSKTVHCIDGRIDFAVKYAQGETIQSVEDINLLHEIISKPLAEKCILAEESSKNTDTESVLENWIGYLHRSISVDRAILSNFSPKKKAALLKNMIASKSLVKKNINKRLILENICISI